MSSLLDDVKKSFGEWLSKTADKAGEFTREAADKAEEVTRLGKIKLDIFKVKRDIDKVFTDLGGSVYHLIAEEKTKNIEKNEKVKSYINQVKDLEKNLKEKEKQYKKTKECQPEKHKKGKKKEGSDKSAPEVKE